MFLKSVQASSFNEIMFLAWSQPEFRMIWDFFQVFKQKKCCSDFSDSISGHRINRTKYLMLVWSEKYQNKTSDFILTWEFSEQNLWFYFDQENSRIKTVLIQYCYSAAIFFLWLSLIRETLPLDRIWYKNDILLIHFRRSTDFLFDFKQGTCALGCFSEDQFWSFN